MLFIAVTMDNKFDIIAGCFSRNQKINNSTAEKWNINAADCKTSESVITNSKGDRIKYGEIASLAGLQEVPNEVKLKEPKDFKIIGTDRRNVDLDGIITGKSAINNPFSFN